jgi:hypothetical protein
VANNHAIDEYAQPEDVKKPRYAKPALLRQQME